MLHLRSGDPRHADVVDVLGRAVAANAEAFLLVGPAVLAAVLAAIGDNATALTPDGQLH